MKQTTKTRESILRNCLLVLLLPNILLFAGCAAVSPWEKGMLGDPAMKFSSEQESSIYEQHMLNAREASSGGYGGAGGGCGCK